MIKELQCTKEEAGIKAAHCNVFGVPAEAVVSVPLFFHLIGGQSGFFKDKTLSMPLSKRVAVSVNRRKDNTVNFCFMEASTTRKCTITTLHYRKEDKWASNLKAILFAYSSLDFKLVGLNIMIHTQLLPRTGLGVNAGIRLALALALERLLFPNMAEGLIYNVLCKAVEVFLKKDFRLVDYLCPFCAKENSLILTDYKAKDAISIPFSMTDYSLLVLNPDTPIVHLWDKATFFTEQNTLILGDLKEKSVTAFGGWDYQINSPVARETLSNLSMAERQKILSIIAEHKCILQAKIALDTGNIGHFLHAINMSYKNMTDLYDFLSPESEWLIKRIMQLNSRATERDNPSVGASLLGNGVSRGIFAFLPNTQIDTFKTRLEEFEKMFAVTCNIYNLKIGESVYAIK